MAFWDSKPVTDPEKQLKKLTKYCIQVLGLSKEEAEKKPKTCSKLRVAHPLNWTTDPIQDIHQGVNS